MTEERRKSDRRVSPAVGEFAVQERAQLLARIAELEGRGVQGGEREAVEVVAYGFPNSGLGRTPRMMLVALDTPGNDQYGGRLWEPLMTVAQHERIVAALTAQQCAMPEGWTNLQIEHEPGYPEDVAFGPQIMMDRLKKWLDKYFAMQIAQQGASVAVPEGWRVNPVTDNGVTGFVIGTPRGEDGIRSNTSVWIDDDDPAHQLLAIMLAAPSPASLSPVAPSPVSGLVEALEKFVAAYKADGGDV